MQEFSQTNSTVMEPDFAVRPVPRGEGIVSRPMLPERSIAIPFLLYTISLYTVLSWRVRETTVIETDDFIDLNVMVNITTLFVCGILFVILIRWTILQYGLLFRGPTLWFTIFVGAAGVSVFWSSYIQLSVYRLTELVLSFLITLSIISRINSRKRIIHTLALLGIMAMVFWMIQRFIFLVYFDVFKLKLWDDLPILCKSNFGGAASACVCIIGLAMLMAPKGNRSLVRSLIYFFIGAAGLIIFRSAASFFALEWALLVLLVYRKRIMLLGIGGTILLASLLFANPSRSSVERTILVGKEAKHIRTWTGRRAMWVIARRMIREKPGLGYSFGAAERKALAKRTKETMGRSWSNSHNGFLGAFLGTGMLGGIPLIISFLTIFYFLFKAFVVLKQSDPSEYRVFYDVLIGVFSVLTVNNLSIPGIGAARAQFMYPLFIFICLAITKHEHGGLK